MRLEAVYWVGCWVRVWITKKSRNLTATPLFTIMVTKKHQVRLLAVRQAIQSIHAGDQNIRMLAAQVIRVPVQIQATHRQTLVRLQVTNF